LELTFFTLTQEYRVSLFNQIHEIVFHGKGGYDYDTIYNMPIWLRTFTYQKINNFYEDEAEATKKASGKSSTPAMGPNIKKPSYSTKARK
jgi:hypothetical protein